MLTRELLMVVRKRPEMVDHELTNEERDSLFDAALLGLAIIGSGVTAEDIERSGIDVWDPTGDERDHSTPVREALDALAKALRDGGAK